LSPNSGPAAAVLGCSGTTLTEAERTFFRASDPFGLILFARNIAAPETVRRLILDFREAVGRPGAPVLIDQEGGRVARLKPPHWPALPPAGSIERLAEPAASEAAQLLGQAIAATVSPLGIDVACAPVADIRAPDANPTVIGDRAYSGNPRTVAKLAGLTESALRAAGIATTPKHAPGHGRALTDSHFDLPHVAAPLADLERDLAPFKAMTAAPMWMTAHIVYDALDAGTPATCSKTVLDWLRRETAYQGLIVSDDLAMKALSGPVDGNARASIHAGCDLILYCPGDIAGGQAAINGAGPMSQRAVALWTSWVNTRPTPPQADAFALAAKLWALIETGAPVA
jgi:beta-N-acetylhexosaminidase